MYTIEGQSCLGFFWCFFFTQQSFDLITHSFPVVFIVESCIKWKLTVLKYVGEIQVVFKLFYCMFLKKKNYNFTNYWVS